VGFAKIMNVLSLIDLKVLCIDVNYSVLSEPTALISCENMKMSILGQFLMILYDGTTRLGYKTFRYNSQLREYICKLLEFGFNAVNMKIVRQSCREERHT
jgi:hypothetical protein